MSTSSNSLARINTADLAYIAVFTALIIVFAFVAIPVGTAGVPIVLQNAVIILSGLVLGGKRGFCAAALFLLLGLAGLPVLAGGRSALAAIGGPTVGYLVGYVISAGVSGAIAYRAKPGHKGQILGFGIAAGIIGLLIQYFFGALGLIWRADLGFGEANAAQGVFVLPGCAKVAVMVAIATAVHTAFPDLLSRKR